MNNILPHGTIFTIPIGGGVDYTWDKVIVLVITLPVLVALTYLVQRTRRGKAMRATAQDREAAAMMGIDVDRTISFTFLLAGCLAGAAGVIYALYFTNLTFLTGFRVGLIAFTAAVFGGIGNLPGAVLGALLIGLMEAFVNGLGWHSPGSNWTEAVIFAILILDPRLPSRGPPRRTDARGGVGVATPVSQRPGLGGAWWRAARAARPARVAVATRFPAGSSGSSSSAPSACSRWSCSRRSTASTPAPTSMFLVDRGALRPRLGPLPVRPLRASRRRCSRSASPTRTTSTTCPALPIFTAFPTVDTAFVMAIYVMMALGLNIVVGYAGLLDLGYVAFYAIGAYTAAWLASPQALALRLEPRLRRRRRAGRGRRHPHLDLARARRRGAAWRRSPGS